MSTLNFTLLFLVGLAISSTVHGMDEEMAEVARALRESCIEETNQDEGMLNKINAGADIPDDPTLKCYMKCVMESAGMLSDGVVEIDTVLALLPEDMKIKNEASIKSCGSPKGSDDCDIAWKTQVCWQKSNKAVSFSSFIKAIGHAAGLLHGIITTIRPSFKTTTHAKRSLQVQLQRYSSGNFDQLTRQLTDKSMLSYSLS